MRIVILTLLLLGASALALDAQSETYRWVTEDGSISFADDEKQVPKRNRESATVVDLKTIGLEKLTPTKAADTAEEAAALTSRLERLRTSNATPSVNPNRLTDCSGHVTVTSERIQVGDHNRRVFIATDECGRVTSVTPFYPEVQINR